MQPVKLLMTWDILPGQEQAYIEFNAKEFVPWLMKKGLQPSDSWYTLYGEAPQVMVGWIGRDAKSVRQALRGDDWRELRSKLHEFVTNFEFRIVPVSGPFQM